jgi:hypothetical protein
MEYQPRLPLDLPEIDFLPHRECTCGKLVPVRLLDQGRCLCSETYTEHEPTNLPLNQE